MGAGEGNQVAKRQIKASSVTLAWILVCGSLLVTWLQHNQQEAYSGVIAVVMLFGASVVLVDILSTAYNFGLAPFDVSNRNEPT